MTMWAPGLIMMLLGSGAQQCYTVMMEIGIKKDLYGICYKLA